MLLLGPAGDPSLNPTTAAGPFVDEAKGVADVAEALAGARDIIAETVSEDSRARAAMRQLFRSRGVIKSKVVKDHQTTGIKYQDYFEWEDYYIE